MFIKVAVTGKDGWYGSQVSGATGQFLPVNPNANVTAVAGNNMVTITLNDGAFKTQSLVAPIVPAVAATDFIWTGADATLLNAGNYTRTSATTVTVMTSAPLTVGAVNNVVVKSTYLATASTGVTAAASTVVAFSDLTLVTYATVVGQNTVTVTLTGGSFKGSVAMGDFTFPVAGATNEGALITGGALVRTSSTVVTITGTAAFAGTTTNTLVVKASAMATQSTSAAVASSLVISPILSLGFPMATGNNAVTISLTNGTFKAPTAVTFAENVSQSDLVWTGTDAAALGAGTVTYIDNVTLVITNIAAPYTYAGINNTVSVKSSALATVTGVLSVSAAASTGNIALTTPIFASTLGNTSLVITLTGAATFQTGSTLNASDFVFGGTNAARFIAGTGYALSGANKVLTITVSTIVTAADNVITIKQSAFATGAVSTTVAATL